MFSVKDFLGCPVNIKELRDLNDKLNGKVIDQLNESQELVMINNFARESNEYQFKACLQHRISDIASWRWVFEDLLKRLGKAEEALHHERNALRVVVERIDNEIEEHSREASKPGALNPMTDAVEKTILEENKFLKEEKKNFENLITELEKQVKSLERTKKRIEEDILKKQKALSVENTCATIDLGDALRKNDEGKKKRKRFSSLIRWENRCVSLKRIGLHALTNAIVTRQQVRGARVHLSITAEAFAAKVDAALRRRLHTNVSKLEELSWQREEAIRDMKSLDEELIATEKNLLETMDQERLVVARLADRARRPPGEITTDEVHRRLKDELGRLSHFMKHLRNNIERITSLRHRLEDSISQIDCCAEDISRVFNLDRERMNRREREGEHDCQTSDSKTSILTQHRSPTPKSVHLTSIKEEEESDYPFDD